MPPFGSGGGVGGDYGGDVSRYLGVLCIALVIWVVIAETNEVRSIGLLDVHPRRFGGGEY